MSREGRVARSSSSLLSGLENAVRAVAPGLLVALPALSTLIEVVRRAAWGVVGRDQGIFQYVAWAAEAGDRVYADIRDVNGPLVPLVHTVLLALGGADEHRFRVLDLLFTGLTAAFAGGCLAALETRRPRRLRIAGLALAGWVVSAAQYLAYGSWDTAQRESFFDGFALVALGAQMVASCMLPARGERPSLARAHGWLLVAGAASSISCFGKPTFALVTLGQLAVLLIDDRAGKLRALAVFALGTVLGALPPLLFLVLRGDPRAFLRIAFADVPAMYRFIWPRTASAVLFGATRPSTVVALVASLAIVILVVGRRMPRRSLLLVVLPLAGLASVVAQAKGFFYHYHPVSQGTALALLALVHQGWHAAERLTVRRAGLVQLLAGGICLGLGVRTFALARASVAYYAPAPATDDPEEIFGEARLAFYRRVDFFPFAMRRAARFLAANTRSEDRVQVYGMDPYLLFLAGRRSATPYIYGYDLNVDAALHGSFDDDGPRPSATQREVIARMQREHEDDLLTRMQAAPPAAFVTVDRSPLMNDPDAWSDFVAHCPRSAAWVERNYRRAADFDEMHVWLRTTTGIGLGPSPARAPAPTE